MGGIEQRGASRACLIAGALIVATGQAGASPLELYGFGGRSPALAGAGQTDSAAFDSSYLNPARLGHLPHKRLSFGYLFSDFSLRMDGSSTGTETAQGTMFGAGLPLPLGEDWNGRIGLGLGFYVPVGTLVRVRVPQPGEPVFALLETRSQTIGILVTTGVRINDEWSAGAGVHTLAALTGQIFIDVDGAGNFATDSEQGLETHFAPVAGVAWNPSSLEASFGLTLRGESRADYDIVVTNDVARALPLGLPTIRIAGAAQYDPLTIESEARWDYSDDLSLYAQLAYMRWSAFPPPTENPLMSQPEQEPPDFHDTVKPRLAAELRRPAPLAGQMAFRAGYHFAWSPAPEQSEQLSLLDNHRHVFAAGYGIAWPGRYLPFYIDAWMQLHLLQSRTHQKDPGAFGPDMPLPFETLSTSGRIVVGGMTVGVDL